MSAMHATGQHHDEYIIASLIAFDFANVAAMKAMIKLQTILFAETLNGTHHCMPQICGSLCKITK